jgi:hypothetical protein
MIFRRKAPAAAPSLLLTRDSGDSFHAVGRAPKRSKPRVSVEHDDRAAALTLDFGVGERGREMIVLTVTKFGMFTLPVLSKNELVSVRGRNLPVGEVKITVGWASE